MKLATTPDAALNSIEELLRELRSGRPVVLVDDEDRENEGDLVVAAEKITPASLSFMVRHGCGVLGLALSRPLCDRLGLETVPGRNVAEGATPWTPHIDARVGITTGTSAHDRARTVQVAIDERTTPADIVVGKGHVPCLRARDGGVLVRAGHTEGSVDLARLAGWKAAAVICEIMSPDGRMARRRELHDFCRQHGLKISSIAELIRYRRSHEVPVTRELAIELPTPHGTFDLIAYRAFDHPEPHLALCMGDVGRHADDGASALHDPPLVRIHSQCLTGETFGSALCDCGGQLDAALADREARTRRRPLRAPGRPGHRPPRQAARA
jgi:3,4-dihydroxy 2-butanone 4-phosphate synthase / GTP cyclohydrolase II